MVYHLANAEKELYLYITPTFLSVPDNPTVNNQEPCPVLRVSLHQWQHSLFSDAGARYSLLQLLLITDICFWKVSQTHPSQKARIPRTELNLWTVVVHL